MTTARPEPAGPGTPDALSRFHPLVRDWFTGAFADPTPAQTGAWDAIGRGEHTLVVAPTGSGKTLAAFLSSIDELVTARLAGAELPACTVLYLSPLKALAVDVERNLQAPLAGLRGLATARGSRSPRSRWRSGRGTPRRRTGGPSPATAPTSSSPPRSRCSCC
ncbi:MAG: DEAD/DEAH box helicase [Nakamurella multipartita]